MYKVDKNKIVKHLDFLLISELSLIISFLISIFLKTKSFDYLGQELYVGTGFIIVIIDAFVIIFFDLYDNVLRRGYLKELSSSIYEVVISLALLSSYLVLTKQSGDFSRSILYITYIIDLVLSYSLKIYYKNIKFINNASDSKQSLLLIAKKGNFKEIEDFIKNNVIYRLSGILFVDNCFKEKELFGVEVIENEDDIVNKISKMWIDEVLFFKGANKKELVEELSLAGFTIHLKIDKNDSIIGQEQFIEQINGSNVLTSTIKTISGQQYLIKRLVDIVGGMIGSVITIMLTIFIGPIIYFSDKGPIFYKQDRIGQNGRVFKMYKFRSMYINTDELKSKFQKDNKIKDGMMFKMDNDPRIIKGIGNFIRTTSIDEFPQFFNILKGDMSLVGTRPPTLDEWKKYKLHHRARMSIKPGLTGLWQVSGRSNITDFEEVVKLDCEYIASWSFALDIKILFKTVKVVFRKEGSM